MRQGEVFHSLRMLPGAWVVLRVDGRGFSRLTEERYEKPFDARFHEVMVRTASTLLEELQGLYAYTQSDEISVLFRPEWSLFDRLEGSTVSSKNELLFQRGINFNEVPLWQRRGTGLFWERYVKEGVDPRDGRRVLTERRRLKVEPSLPMKEEYEAWLRRILEEPKPEA